MKYLLALLVMTLTLMCLMKGCGELTKSKYESMYQKSYVIVTVDGKQVYEGASTGVIIQPLAINANTKVVQIGEMETSFIYGFYFEIWREYVSDNVVITSK
jgi:hypothetical protein